MATVGLLYTKGELSRRTVLTLENLGKSHIDINEAVLPLLRIRDARQELLRDGSPFGLQAGRHLDMLAQTMEYRDAFIKENADGFRITLNFHEAGVLCFFVPHKGSGVALVEPTDEEVKYSGADGQAELIRDVNSQPAAVPGPDQAHL